MKRFLTTMTITFVLSVSALAGDIPSVGINSPGPDETTTASSTPAPGEVPTVGYTTAESETALNLIQMMVGLIA